MKTYQIFIRTLFLSGILLFVVNISFAQEEEKTEHKTECKDHHGFGMKGMKIENKGNDSVIVYINKNEMNWGHCPMKHPFWCRKGKYNGHWAGVELGWNGYVNSDFNMDFDKTPYMNMNVARSMMVNLNPFELNLNLAFNQAGRIPCL